MRGGQTGLFPDDLNVESVPLDQIKVFTVAHNTFSHTYFVPLNTWYNNGQPITFDYPQEYILQDGSVLTIDYADHLVLNQI